MGEGNPAEGEFTGGGRHHGSGDKGSRSGNMEKMHQMELWLSVQLAQSHSQ
jgi:hypothetical protein